MWDDHPVLQDASNNLAPWSSEISEYNPKELQYLSVLGGGLGLQLRAREEDSLADCKSSNLEKERKKTREGMWNSHCQLWILWATTMAGLAGHASGAIETWASVGVTNHLLFWLDLSYVPQNKTHTWHHCWAKNLELDKS